MKSNPKKPPDSRLCDEVYVQICAEKGYDGEHLLAVDTDEDVAANADLNEGDNEAPYKPGARVAVYTFSHFETWTKVPPQIKRKRVT